MNTSRNLSTRLLDRFFGVIEITAPSDRFLLRGLFFITLFSGIWLLFSVSQSYSEETPIYGGVLREGIIGTPRFVNPALAITRADQDVTALVYSGLLKISPAGTLIPNIAESITVSDDGLTYNILVRNDITFHDGTRLTAKDVSYTIRLIQDPDLKSPLRGNWADVTIEEIGEYELNVVLAEPYAPFIENFLVGIMPQHLWGALPVEQLPFSQLNTEPIGSGSFTLERAERDASGLIERYILSAYQNNTNVPKIDTFELHFFTNETNLITALKNELVDASAYISNENISDLTKNAKFITIQEPLPRVFGIFFNQNRSAVLRDTSVREALTTAIDRDELIRLSLAGYGVPITSPIIQSGDALELIDSSIDPASSTSLDEAKNILAKAGWLANNRGLLEKQIDGNTEILSITLRTSNVPLFDAVMKEVVARWEALGVEVSTEQFEQTGLVQSVIRPRDFQALLFGLDMSRSQDLYPFWHSSQKDDPGLNIAQYTNISVDELLTKSRIEQDPELRRSSLTEASNIILSEKPAIFLFQPQMAYVVSENIIIPPMSSLGRPSDRFNNITDWHTDSDELWPIFQ